MGIKHFEPAKEQTVFKALFNANPDATVIIDTYGIIQLANSQTEKLFGYKRNELPGEAVEILIPAAFHQDIIKYREDYIKDSRIRSMGSGLKLEAIKKDGVKFPVEISLSSLQTEGGILILVSIYNINYRKENDENLIASELRYRRLFETAKDGILILDEDTGAIDDVNPFLCEMLGYSYKEFLGKQLWEIGLFKDIAANKNNFLKLQQTGYVRYKDLPLKTKAGHSIWVEFVSNVYDVSGKRVIQCNIRDITDRKKREEELKENEFFFRESQKAGNIGSYKINFSKGYWQSSETLDSIFGIEKNYDRTIEGWLNIVHPDNKHELDEYLHIEVIGKRKPFNKEYRIRRINDKQTKWVCGMGDLKFDDNGNVTEMIGTIQDITERKNAEKLLFKSQQNYKNLLENMNDGFMVDDVSGKVIYANKTFLEIFDFTDDDMNHLFLEKYVAPEYVELLSNRHDRRLHGENVPEFFEFEGLRKDGKRIWLEVHVNPIIENEVFIGSQSIFRDITQSKGARIALLESEETFRRVFNESADSVLLLGDNGFTDCNQSAVSILDFASKQDIIKMQPWEISPEKQPDGRLSREKAIAMIAIALQQGYNRFEWVHIKSDKTEFYVEVMLTPITLSGKQLYYTVWRDITERKRAEEKLEESNERFEFVNKATQDTIWEWDYRTNKGKWGDGFIKIFGYTEDKLNYSENWLEEYVHPSDKEEMVRKLHVCIESGIRNWQHEYRFRCADGNYKYVYDRGFILYNDNGEPYRMIGSMTDVTERKELERELVQMLVRKQQLITETTIQAQEKERDELGRELHDNINQILATVKMYLGMAKAKENTPVDLVNQSYEYVNEVIEEIRKLSHSLVTPSLGDLGLKDALQGLVEEINLLNKLEVRLFFDEEYHKKDNDKTKELMFYRIVQEQLNNISKYANADKVIISLRANNENIGLTVTDNGVGFDIEQKSNGIGLKNIRSRVEFYAGDMKIISSPGNGCKLEINIPGK